jgi:hypothetical protein
MNFAPLVGNDQGLKRTHYLLQGLFHEVSLFVLCASVFPIILKHRGTEKADFKEYKLIKKDLRCKYCLCLPLRLIPLCAFNSPLNR